MTANFLVQLTAIETKRIKPSPDRERQRCEYNDKLQISDKLGNAPKYR
jgi:hypothetical protein